MAKPINKIALTDFTVFIMLTSDNKLLIGDSEGNMKVANDMAELNRILSKIFFNKSEGEIK